MSDKNDVVIIELDRPREVRFGHKALKQMTANLKIDINTFELDGSDLEQIEKIMFYALQSDARKNNEQLELKDMEDLLDQAPSYSEIIDKMSLALEKAFGQFEVDEKNLIGVVENSKKN